MTIATATQFLRSQEAMAEVQPLDAVATRLLDHLRSAGILSLSSCASLFAEVPPQGLARAVQTLRDQGLAVLREDGRESGEMFLSLR